MPALAGSFGALRHENFRWYWIALTVNTAGNTMAGVALAFAVLSITNSASALGLVLAAETVPMVLFMLFGGVLADRLPITLVLRAGFLVTAITQAVMAGLVISGVARIWMMVVLAVITGLASAAGFPALISILPRLVPRDLLQQANALQSLSRGALRVIGPTVSALVVVGAGAGWALAFDAATWFAAAALLTRVRLPPPAPREEQPSTFAELRTGWDYFRRTTWLWTVVLGFSFLNVIHSGAWLTLGPARAKETFGATGWGLVLSAESVGLLATTFVMLRRPLRRPLRAGMLGIATLALPIAFMGWYPHLDVLLVCTFIAGAGTEIFSMGWSLAMQENVPEGMLSRATSYDVLGSIVAVPVGQLAFGPLGAAYGYRDVMVVSGCAYAVICLVVLASRSVRDLRRTPVAEATPVS
jgi:MFS family permease